MVDFKKILAGANKNWKKAKKRVADAEPQFQEFEDGRYTARLVSAKIGQSGSGRNQIDFGWKFEDGEYEGKTKHNYQGLDNEDNLYYLGRDLERLGYELPDDLTDLIDILKDIEKNAPVASIVLKSKGDFQNVYIRKVFTAGDDEDDQDEETDDEEETDTAEESDEEESEDESEDESEEESDEESDDEESEDEGSEDESDEEESDEEESEEEDESDDEESDEEESEEEIDVEVGMRVQAETAKGREPGKIIAILEDEGQVRVKLDSGKTVRVSGEQIEIEPPEKKTPSKPSKKPAAKSSAPAPKKKAKPEPTKKPSAKKKNKR